MKNGALAFCALFAIYSAAFGATLTWSGGESGAFSDTTWTIGGEPAGRSPVIGDTVVIPVDCKVTATESDRAVVTALSAINLNGTLECTGFTSTSVFLTGLTLSGSGEFRVISCGNGSNNGGDPRVDLYFDSRNFTGPFFFSNTWVNVRSANALGGKNGGHVSFYRGDVGGSAGGFDFYAAGDYPNDFYFDCNRAYAMTIAQVAGVTNSGTITCVSSANSYCNRLGGNGRSMAPTYSGKILVSKCFVDINNARIIGDEEFFSGTKYILCDSGYFFIGAKLAADVPYLTLSKSSAAIYAVFEKANVVNGVPCYWGANAVYDLNGFNQEFGNVSVTDTGSTYKRFTSTGKPAMATMKGTSLAAGNKFGVALEGKLSLVFDAAGKTMVLTNNAAYPSTTDGALIVSNGTLVLNESVRLPNVSTLAVAGGTMSLLAGAQVANSASLDLSGGTFSVASGTLEVSAARVNDVFVTPATYSVAEPGPFSGLISGGGSIKVLRSAAKIDSPTVFEWKGGSGTSLATGANWEGGVAPSLTAGTALLKFGKSVQPAQVEGRISIYGIVYDGDAAFTLAAGTGLLSPSDTEA